MAERNLKNLFGILSTKSVPPIDQIQEVTRDGLPKAFIPFFFYKPPFGYPRYTDLAAVRRLAATPYVEMCINLILDEMSPIEWDIVTDDGMELDDQKQSEIDHIKSFFENPNTNKESFEEIRRQYLRDVLEIDTGVVNKMFNLKEEMVEIVARDGATFTKNPDIYGMLTDREDIILDTNIDTSKRTQSLTALEPGWISQADVREKAAYFQYGWSTAARPVPFGKKELIFFEKNKRTDSIYGRGMVEVLANTIQTFIYAIENDLEFFSDNQIPKGILGLEGSNVEEIKAFKDQWVEQQRTKDQAGHWKKKMHKVPIVGKVPTFTSIQFTSAEMELIEKQKWWAKMVWACFGVTGSELGYTEDAKGMGNQIVQSSSFRKRTIYPLLRLEEYRLNHEIISEFYETGKKKEIQKAILKGLSENNAKKKVGEMDKLKQLPYQGLKFKFMIFDVEEETKKANLYKLQIDAGIRTINEIRKDEGLEELEWGSNDPKERENSGFGNNNFGDPLENEYQKKKKESKPVGKKEEKGGPGSGPQEGQGVASSRMRGEAESYTSQEIMQYGILREGGMSREEAHEKIMSSRKILSLVHGKDIETKPGMGHSDKWWEIYHALIKEGRSEESASKIANSKEEKALIDNPLILGPNERMNSDRLKQSIVYLMKENEKKINDLIEKEIGQNKIQEIKSVDELAKKIKEILTFSGLKLISDAVIKNEFMKGWEDSEKQINRNLIVNREAMQFIQDYTFNNIKSMTDEIMTDLRQELERGIMAGEGITKLKDRIGKVFDVGENRADMIARTESNRAENQGKFIAIKNSGEKYKKKWLAAMDERTSEQCKHLNGQIVNLNDNFKDGKGWEGPCPPAHVDCRSSVIFIRDEE